MKQSIFILSAPIILSALLSLSPSSSLLAQPEPRAVEAWKENKFSMFIHFGIYSSLGGVWEGRPVTRGLSEQIQAHAGIYSDTYAHVADSFDPVRWDADSIALLAKAAGMRSIVITSKHHDGFCMFHSAYTDFNIVDATPFKRDVVKELSDACKRHGLRFGVYFSLIDWHFPQASPISSHNSDYITPEHHTYNKKQVTELMTKYGTISEIWFDMGSQSAEQSKELANLVHSLQPDCMISSRIGNDQGDFTVMGDNQEPDYRIGVPWQSPASFFDDTWGYRSWQVRGSESDKTREKLASLIRVVSRGGNYLLNIGPRGDGSVVGFEKDVLLAIGKWLQKNGDAIYGTHPDPFEIPFDWGSITRRPGKLYLHILNPPKIGLVTLPGLIGKPVRVYTLGEEGKDATGKARPTKEGIVVTLPHDYNEIAEFGRFKDPYKVVVLEFDGDYSLMPAHLITAGKAPLTLDHRNAFKSYSNSTVDYNSRYTSTIEESWTLWATGNKTYTPTLYYTAEEKGRSIVLEKGERYIKEKGKSVRTVVPLKLDDDDKLPLNNDTASLTWSPLYLAGPLSAGIDGLNGNVDSIDIRQPWPGKDDKPWLPLTPSIHELKAGMNTAYYLLQEITSSKEQACLVHITSGDGVLVLLNGKQLLVHNNPFKAPQMEDIVLLPLKEGSNQLVVKLFNNFQKKILFFLDHQGVEQVLYRKRLDSIYLSADDLYQISWKLDHPRTPHEELRLPNLSLKLE